MAERDIFREFGLFTKMPKVLIAIGLLPERVQMGMALTPAEKLQALNTPYVKYISTLLQQHVHDPQTGLTLYLTDWDRSRGRDFQNLAIIMSLIEIYPEKRNNFAAGSLQTWLRRTDPIDNGLQKKMEAALECMTQIVRDYPEHSVSVVSRRISPLGKQLTRQTLPDAVSAFLIPEFCFFGLICYVLSEYYLPSQIAQLYGQYRMHMRSTNEKGVRADAATIADSYKWIERVPRRKRVIRPAEELNGTASPNRGKL